MNTFLQTLRNLGPVRLAAMGVVALGLIGFFVYLMTRLSTPDMALLYGDLDPKDGGAIVRQLEEQKVPHQVNPEGTRIMVPADQVGRLRMVMAQAGLPAGGSIGYEIYDKPEGFGTTSFVQGVNHLRATEGELARTVGTLAAVQQARVHLVLPKREMFSRSQQAATASVFLKLRAGQSLKREQIVAIQHLIAAAVPQLEPNQISIIDDRGNLLARGMGAGGEQLLQANADEKKQAYEQRTTRVIEDLLSRSLGFGKVRAEVTADLDFDRITTSSEIFDPESQVIRSTQTVEDNNESTDRDAADPVTVANNLPTAGANGADASATSRTKGARTEETVNYEISKTVKSHVRESGQVRRLSVAVLVDGVYTPVPDGPPTYAARPKEEMAQIEALVRSAIGFDAVRGDTVEVINMRFATPDAEFADAGATFLGMAKEDLFRIAEMLVLAIVAILVILLVVRPLMAKAFERSGGADEEEEADRLLADHSAGQAQLTGPGALAQDLALEDAQASEELEQMIDINRVEGRVRASSMRKVGEIVDKHPEEAVSIIRSWLYQET
ncbi:flagellar M-ring protein FliF [Skermanella stibiiresistens SB22]|uniref:Flagellar M-ring protein n=1 Tax=Skermanella stibiiresistens SB22 TaxID=1385369 RepID=W9GPR2_9PROT|nr:flagellar basal-body MS-ring/collar protein FliF [Skermanella stibiiresistens]EWY35885.1 flagellar M-ring protein FliF [Skermanella stibiiresistens SB22]